MSNHQILTTGVYDSKKVYGPHEQVPRHGAKAGKSASKPHFQMEQVQRGAPVPGRGKKRGDGNKKAKTTKSTKV